jgi:hypothetical protein
MDNPGGMFRIISFLFRYPYAYRTTTPIYILTHTGPCMFMTNFTRQSLTSTTFERPICPLGKSPNDSFIFLSWVRSCAVEFQAEWELEDKIIWHIMLVGLLTVPGRSSGSDSSIDAQEVSHSPFPQPMLPGGTGVSRPHAGLSSALGTRWVQLHLGLLRLVGSHVV